MMSIRASRPIRGALRTSRTLRRDAVDAGHGARRTPVICGRRSRVVLAPRRWRSSRPRCSRIAPMTVAKEPGHRGEREVSRKPLRRESRRCSGSPVVLPPCFFVARGPWVQSAPGFPCALCLMRVAKFMQGSGTSCREDAGVWPRCYLICESGVSTRHCEERKRRRVRPKLKERRRKQSMSQQAVTWIASLRSQ